MKPLPLFTIFISHASPDYELARLMRDVLADEFGLQKAEIFCSSDNFSLYGGHGFVPQIRRALKQVKAVVALLTPNSVFRPWVLYETGAVLESGKLFPILAKGLPFASIPDPLSSWQARVLENPDGIDEICRDIGMALNRKRVRRSLKRKALVNKARPIAGDFHIVKPALVAHRSDRSPYSFENLLTANSLQKAKKHLFIAGQNLRFLGCKPTTAKCKKLIFDWLKAAPTPRERRFELLISSTKSDAISTWCSVVGDQFKQSIAASTTTFRRWNKEADKGGLDFNAKLTHFVPVSIIFMDPDESFGVMVITPVVFEHIAEKRPHFVIGKRENEPVFSYYWDSYKARFNSSESTRL